VPFFDRYYAGGIGSVRGYDQSSLAPRSASHKDQILGGDTMVAATAELQFPMPFAEDVKGLKMSTFVDAGNAYNRSTSTGDEKAIRYSAGIGAVWLSPIGPFEVSYAKPINSKTGDEEQKVQFSIGASF
jgi:outer membrane protein insertion porin family